MMTFQIAGHHFFRGPLSSASAMMVAKRQSSLRSSHLLMDCKDILDLLQGRQMREMNGNRNVLMVTLVTANCKVCQAVSCTNWNVAHELQ